jgi:hypothetical protein
VLDLLLKLIDRLIQLRSYQAERLQKTFDDILGPTFEDLLEVHRDYVKMFEHVRGELPDPSEIDTPAGRQKLKEVAEALRRRRLEFEPVRTELNGLIREIQGSRYGAQRNLFSGEAQEFLDAVIAYFPEGYLKGTRDASRATALYAAIRSGADSITTAQIQRDGSTLPELVDDTITDCRQRWSVVCEKFAALRLAVRAAH